MCEAAADRAAIAHLIVSDMSDRFDEERMRFRKLCIRFDVAPARARAQQFRTSTRTDGCESRKAIVGSRLWPPAMIFASPRFSASTLTTSAGVDGATYSKFGSFICSRCDSSFAGAPNAPTYCSSVIFPALMTCVQRASSARVCAASSAGVLPTGVAPSDRKRSRTSASATAFTISE
jgi:hypothetical protein